MEVKSKKVKAPQHVIIKRSYQDEVLDQVGESPVGDDEETGDRAGDSLGGVAGFGYVQFCDSSGSHSGGVVLLVGLLGGPGAGDELHKETL